MGIGIWEFLSPVKLSQKKIPNKISLIGDIIPNWVFSSVSPLVDCSGVLTGGGGPQSMGGDDGACRQVGQAMSH